MPTLRPVRWAGVEWSWSEHAVCVIDDTGAALERSPSVTSPPGCASARNVRTIRTAAAFSSGAGASWAYPATAPSA
jgi:hypothetical protein